MPLVAVASRHSIKSRLSSQSNAIWISDDQLWQAFNRFSSLLLTSSKEPCQRAILQQKRLGSNVPGPRQGSRKYPHRRRYNGLSSIPTASENYGPPNDIYVGGLHESFWVQPNLLPSWNWQPPQSKPPEKQRSPILPSWLLPPKLPQLYQNPSHPRVDLLVLHSQPSKQTQKLSVSDYNERLRNVCTLQELKKLHKDLANATLEEAVCSSLAFDHLLSINKTVRAHKRDVSISDLLTFVQDQTLEHTAGENLSRLAMHMVELNCGLPQWKTLTRLVKEDLKNSATLSIQALARLYQWTEQVLLSEPSNGKVRVAWNMVTNDSKFDMRNTVLTNFEIQLQREPDISSTATPDLINLIHISSALKNPKSLEKALEVILEKIFHAAKAKILTVEKLSLIMSRFSTISLSEKSTNNTKLLEKLTKVWRLQEVSMAPSEIRTSLLESMLTSINHFPVTESTIALTSELIQGYASMESKFKKDLERPQIQNLLNLLLRKFFLHDNVSKETSTTVHDTNTTPEESRPSFTQKVKEVEHGEAITVATTNYSSLTNLLDALPSTSAEKWMSQTFNFFALDLKTFGREQVLRDVNACLTAIRNTNRHEWSGLRSWNQPFWKDILEQISMMFAPAEVPSIFKQTEHEKSICHVDDYCHLNRSCQVDGYCHLDTFAGRDNVFRHLDITCRILIEHWVRRDIELLSTVGDHQSLFRRVSNSEQDKSSTHSTNLENNKEKNLQSRFTENTVSTLHAIYEYWSIKCLDKAFKTSVESRTFLALLKTLQTTNLRLDKFVKDMLQLTAAVRPGGATAGIFHYARLELGIHAKTSTVPIIQSFMRDFSSMNPGRALGLIKADDNLLPSQNPRVLFDAISGKHSKVHPKYIVQCLWKHDPGAILPHGHPDRVSKGSPLTRERIDLVHDIVMDFATASRFSPNAALVSIVQCLRYLIQYRAPLDVRASVSCTLSCLFHGIGSKIPMANLNFCLSLLQHVEGKDVADALLRLVYKRGLIHASENEPEIERGYLSCENGDFEGNFLPGNSIDANEHRHGWMGFTENFWPDDVDVEYSTGRSFTEDITLDHSPQEDGKELSEDKLLDGQSLSSLDILKPARAAKLDSEEPRLDKTDQAFPEDTSKPSLKVMDMLVKRKISEL